MRFFYAADLGVCNTLHYNMQTGCIEMVRACQSRRQEQQRADAAVVLLQQVPFAAAMPDDAQSAHSTSCPLEPAAIHYTLPAL